MAEMSAYETLEQRVCQEQGITLEQLRERTKRYWDEADRLRPQHLADTLELAGIGVGDPDYNPAYNLTHAALLRQSIPSGLRDYPSVIDALRELFSWARVGL